VERGVRELLVLWQHPETREIVPIGRLSHDESGYSFCYTRAASEVDGFRPLPGLGRVGDHTFSPTLPAIFRLRVMRADRPDFPEYVSTLGLRPETATPWEQIVSSGGDRVGDTLQFMELPCVEEGMARARFLANGVRHIPGQHLNVGGVEVFVSPEAHEAALQSLQPGAELDLVPEFGNSYDQCATLVAGSGLPIGWAPRVLSSSIRELLDYGPVIAHVVRVNGPSSPSHLRLVLDLTAPAPEDFQFDRDGRWQPA
jgi:hypothetical protein